MQPALSAALSTMLLRKRDFTGATSSSNDELAFEPLLYFFRLPSRHPQFLFSLDVIRCIVHNMILPANNFC